MNIKGVMTVLRSFLEAYENYCKPLCRELNMPQMAFDILMFLAKNPEHCTAKEISRFRGFKENILSVNINKLVSEGYLERLSVDSDRRKVKLVCTEKAQSIIERGQKIQQEFETAIFSGLSAEEIVLCRRCLDKISENAQQINSPRNERS